MVDRGYITFALNGVHDYLRLAYAQALSIKLSQKINNYCLVLDRASEHLLNEKHRRVFDKIILLDYEPNGWDMSQDWRAFVLSPWRESILLNADMLLLGNIDHWWDVMHINEVVLAKTIVNHRGEKADGAVYRKHLIDAGLPNTYAAFLYWRRGATSTEFFRHAREVSDNKELGNDEIFSIAASLIGAEKCTLPVDVPYFVHCKEKVFNLSSNSPWYEQLYTQWDGMKLRVGHHVQDRPFHYHHKEWLTDDIIRRLERYYEESDIST